MNYLIEQAHQAIQQYINPISPERKAEAYSRRSWAMLHTYPLRVKWNVEEAKKWFSEWNRTRVYNEYCDCSSDWEKILEKHPPDFTNANNFFRWTVLAHNKVNTKLNKQTCTLQEALAIWSKK